MWINKQCIYLAWTLVSKKLLFTLVSRLGKIPVSVKKALSLLFF